MSMSALVVQIALIFIVAIAGTYANANNFDEGSSAQNRIRGIVILWTVVGTAILSIFGQLYNYSETNSSARDQRDTAAKWRGRYDSLRTQIYTSSISIKNEVIDSRLKLADSVANKAVRASKELNEKADWLRGIIEGSQEPLAIETMLEGNFFQFVLRNNTGLPAYCSIRIASYDSLKTCVIRYYK